MSSPEDIQWSEPRWRYMPEWRKAARSIFGFGPIVRMLSLTITVVILLAWYAKRLVPDLEFDWVTTTALVIGGFAGMLALLLLSMRAPPRITVGKEGIGRAGGSRAVLYGYSQIVSIALERPAEDRALLVIQYQPRSRGFKERTVHIGVPGDLDADEILNRIEQLRQASKSSAPTGL